MNKRNKRNSERYKSRHRKECKSHYSKNKEYYFERNRKRREIFRAFIIAAKEKPCADCDISLPYCAMDFDHARGKKKRELGKYHRFSSLKDIEKEIAKCDVVCANCHRIRTFGRSSNRKDGGL